MTERVQNPSSNGGGADVDAVETSEWLEALDAVVSHDGPARAKHLLTRVIERAQQSGTGPIATLNTPYVNTIPAKFAMEELRMPQSTTEPTQQPERSESSAAKQATAERLGGSLQE